MPTVKYKCPDTGKNMKKIFPYNAVGKAQAGQFTKEMGGKKKNNPGYGMEGYNDRLDESLGARNGKKSQSMSSRRNESKGMSKKMYGHSYGADKSMSYRHTAKVIRHDHLR